jgi:hypothetical protein
MMKDLEKMLMSKKDKGEMSEQEMQAKMEVLQELLQMAQEAMGSKVKGGLDEMQKVSVMAPDKESLTKGLDLAKEVAAEAPELTEEEPKEESEEKSEDPMAALAEAKAEEASEEDSDDDSLFGKRPKKNTTSSLMYDEE